MTKSVILAGLVLGITILSGIAVDNAYATFDAFLKLGDLKGESVKPGHEGEIDILSWRFGVLQPGSGGTSGHGGGAGAGKVLPQDLNIVKFIDTSSVVLLRSCCEGSAFDNVKINFFDSSKSDTIPYLQWELTKARVTSYIANGASGDDRPSETITLNYEEFKVTYTTFDGRDNVVSEDSFTLGKRSKA